MNQAGTRDSWWLHFLRLLVAWAGVWLTLVGVYGCIAGVVVWAAILVVEHFTQPAQVYLSLFALAVVPAAVVACAGALVVGLFLQCAERIMRGEPPIPSIDFRHPRPLVVVALTVVFGAAFGLLAACDAVKVVQFTDSNEFCTDLCHAVMEPEAVTHPLSPHSSVHCAECHVGPGVMNYVRSKIAGMRELFALVTNTYERPLETPVKNMLPAEVLCGQCHAPAPAAGTSVRSYAYYALGDDNTRYTLKLMFNTGAEPVPAAEQEDTVLAATHSHACGARQVLYAATDEQAQEIPYVKVVRADGTETVYVDESAGDPVAAVPPHPLQAMDCIDCHNRGMHRFPTPRESVNAALEAGDLDPALPGIKRAAVDALAGDYGDTDEAMESIAAALGGFYRSEFPDVSIEEPARVAAAVGTVQQLYRQSVFPRMRTDWRAHPDNIGHTSYPGCYRCHDGGHVDRDGNAIPNDCRTCHIFAAQGTGPGEPALAADQDFRHPEDIDDMWGELPCMDCHDGTGGEL